MLPPPPPPGAFKVEVLEGPAVASRALATADRASSIKCSNSSSVVESAVRTMMEELDESGPRFRPPPGGDEGIL